MSGNSRTSRWAQLLVSCVLSASLRGAHAQDVASVEQSASEQAKLGHFDDSKAAGGAKKEKENDNDEDHGRGLVILPVVVSDPLLGLGLGAAGMYSFQLGEDPEARGSIISASALVTTHKQFRLALTHDIDLLEDNFVFRGRLWIKIFTEDYWGVGNDTPDSDQRSLKYNCIDYIGRLNIATKYENWFVGPLARINLTWNSRLEQPYPPPELAGDELDSFIMFGVGLSVVYDSRDAVTNPYRGMYLALELISLPSGFPKTSDTVVGVMAASFDARAYWRLVPGWDQFLAVRVHGELTWGRVPFALLPSPGRDDKLRGHLDGRLRDYDLAGIDVEYRVRWWGPLGSTVFAGWGLLWGNPGDRIAWNTMPKSVGVGLRYMVQKADRVNLRLDVAFDLSGTTAVIFDCGEAF